MISSKQNFEDKAYKVGFTLPKIKMIETIKLNLLKQKFKDHSHKDLENLFSFQTPFKFWKSIHWLWRNFSWQKRPL